MARGRISVQFEKGVGTETIEEVLGDFEHKLVTPEVSHHSISGNDTFVGCIYSVRVPVGEEDEVMHRLRRENNEYIKTVMRIPRRYPTPE